MGKQLAILLVTIDIGIIAVMEALEKRSAVKYGESYSQADIIMGKAPHWGVEFSEHPYMDLLTDSFYYNGQDIPLEGEDLYNVDRDAELVEMYDQAAETFEKALTLQHDTCYAHYYLCRIYAHLYADTSKRNPGRKHYKDRFDYHVAQARSFEKSHPLRILWLNRWLNRS